MTHDLACSKNNQDASVRDGHMLVNRNLPLQMLEKQGHCEATQCVCDLTDFAHLVPYLRNQTAADAASFVSLLLHPCCEVVHLKRARLQV